MPSIDRKRPPSRLKPLKAKVVQKHKPADVQRAFAQYFVGEESSGEQRMYCPLCEDPAVSKTPSASINAEQGDWNCLKTDEHGGSIADLVKQLKAEQGFTFRGQATNVAAATKVPVKLYADPLEDQGSPIDTHTELMSNKGVDQLDFLMTEKGLTRETIERMKIGFNAGYYTIPVRKSGGSEWRQIKRIRYSPEGEKDVRQTPGAVSTFYPIENLAGNDLPVIVAEGEWDALLTHQESDRQFVVITGTGGAKTPPRDLSPLDGRDVFIAYDCDDPGTAGAEKLARVLRERGRCKVYIVDLSKFGLPHSKDHGEDLRDFFLKHRRTALDLKVEIERLLDQPYDEDDVLRAVRDMFLASDDLALDFFDEGLTDDQIAELDPPSFVVNGWLMRGFFSILFGQPGVMKTFAIIDLLRHVRAGTRWHGHDTERGAVMLLEGEGLEQTQHRIAAWDLQHPDAELAPALSFERFIDLTQPEGVAAVIRTARKLESQSGVPVVMIAIDPAVEFMTGEETGDGIAELSKGLRALARYLDIAVLVGHHTNADGTRARGTDHLRMRAGAHIRMETLADDLVGLVQEKQKNAQKLAMILQPAPVGQSLVLESFQSMTAAEYHSRKASNENTVKASTRMSVSEAQAAAKSSKAEDLLLSANRTAPGIGRGKLLGACKSQGVGADLLEIALDRLIAAGTIRVERTGTATNAPQKHYVNEAQATS